MAARPNEMLDRRPRRAAASIAHFSLTGEDAVFAQPNARLDTTIPRCGMRGRRRFKCEHLPKLPHAGAWPHQLVLAENIHP